MKATKEVSHAHKLSNIHFRERQCRIDVQYSLLRKTPVGKKSMSNIHFRERQSKIDVQYSLLRKTPQGNNMQNECPIFTFVKDIVKKIMLLIKHRCSSSSRIEG